MDDPRERMKIVRSVRLRPDQYKRHWEDYGISLRSGHIRDMLDLADEASRGLERLQRSYVIEMLRGICGAWGDNDWPDDLHIADILEKHLLCYVTEEEAYHGRE